MKKKEVILLIVFLLFLLFITDLARNLTITALMSRKVIDIEATSSLFKVNFTIDGNPPKLIINSPETKVYEDDETIELQHTVSDAHSSISSVWYSIDCVSNTTITPNQDIDLPALAIGSHILNLYANDTVNNVNHTEYVGFIIGYHNETDTVASTAGAANFTDNVIKEIIPSLNNLPAVSKVNLTLYSSDTPTGWIAVSAARLSEVYNYFNIEVNESTVGGNYEIYFNILSSTLGATSPNDIRANIYGITWQELDTTVIDSTTDPRQFSATTTHFSRFAIGAKGAAAVAGTGGAPSTVYLRRPITPKPIHKPGKLFDVRVNIPQKYRTLTQGEEIIAEINLINIKYIGLVDVMVNYLIKDLDDNIIIREYETKGIETAITYLKKIDTSNLKPGTYMFVIEVKYKDDLAVAGYPITITEKTHIEQPITFIKSKYLLYIIILILVTFGIINYHQYHQIKKLKIKKTTIKDLSRGGALKKR